MENDEFDSDGVANRRTELIETQDFGAVHARCMGDPMDPLILYLHGLPPISTMDDAVVAVVRKSAQAKRGETPQAPITLTPRAPGAKNNTSTTQTTREKAAASKAERMERMAREKKQKDAARDAKLAAGRTAREPSSKAFIKMMKSMATALETLEKAPKPERPKLAPKGPPGYLAGTPGLSTPVATPGRAPVATAGPSATPGRAPIAPPPVATSSTPAPTPGRAPIEKKQRKLTPEQLEAREADIQAKLSTLADKRIELSNGLRARAKALKSTPFCQVCRAPLLTINKTSPCGHTLCPACVEKHLRHFNHCPRCGVVLTGGFPVEFEKDAVHEQILQMRLKTLKSTPATVQSEAARLDTLVAIREKRICYVFEFGKVGGVMSSSFPTPDGERALFLKLILRDVGAQAQLELPAEVVDHVTLSPSASGPEPVAGDPGYLKAPAQSVVGWGYSIPLPAGAGVLKASCVLTVHWNPSLWMAPLQIRFAAPKDTSVTRRVAVQFPASAFTGKQKPSAVEGGVPIVYPSDEKDAHAGGMVVYSTGAGGSRAQATVATYNLAKGQGPPAKTDGDPALAWVGRMMEETDKLVSDALGHSKDVQNALLTGAKAEWPLENVLAQIAAEDQSCGRTSNSSGHGDMLLLKAVSLGSDAAVVSTYNDIKAIMMDKGVRKAMVDKGPEKGGEKRTRSDADRPAHFFHVAIDLPGFGRSPEPPMEDLFNTAFLAEVVMSLGHEHAFAIIAEGESVEPLMLGLIENPKLTSFASVREPIMETLQPPQLHNILHPTYVPWEPAGAPFQITQAGKMLAETLPEVRGVKVNLVKTTSFYDVEMAKAFMEFMAEHNWHGMVTTSGVSKRLPLLTRLDGGIKAFNTGKTDPVPKWDSEGRLLTPPKEEAAGGESSAAAEAVETAAPTEGEGEGSGAGEEAPASVAEEESDELKAAREKAAAAMAKMEAAKAKVEAAKEAKEKVAAKQAEAEGADAAPEVQEEAEAQADMPEGTDVAAPEEAAPEEAAPELTPIQAPSSPEPASIAEPKVEATTPTTTPTKPPTQKGEAARSASPRGPSDSSRGGKKLQSKAPSFGKPQASKKHTSETGGGEEARPPGGLAYLATSNLSQASLGPLTFQRHLRLRTSSRNQPNIACSGAS